MRITTQDTVFSAALAGTVATLAVAAALAMQARRQDKSALQPINATSHWLEGRKREGNARLICAIQALVFSYQPRSVDLLGHSASTTAVAQGNCGRGGDQGSSGIGHCRADRLWACAKALNAWLGTCVGKARGRHRLRCSGPWPLRRDDDLAAPSSRGELASNP
jgi:hypothetical protein